MRLGQCSAVFSSYSRWRRGTESLLNNPSGGGSLNLLRVVAFWKSAQKLKGQYEETLKKSDYSPTGKVIQLLAVGVGQLDPRRDTNSAMGFLNACPVRG